MGVKVGPQIIAGTTRRTLRARAIPKNMPSQRAPFQSKLVGKLREVDSFKTELEYRLVGGGGYLLGIPPLLTSIVLCVTGLLARLSLLVVVGLLAALTAIGIGVNCYRYGQEQEIEEVMLRNWIENLPLTVIDKRANSC